MVSFIKNIATSPNVMNLLRKPVTALYKRKFFRMIDTLHPIPEEL